MGKILAIDYGERKIGLAISDDEQGFAFTHQVLDNKNLNYVTQQLQSICQEENIEEIIIGLPLSLSGEEKSMAKSVRNFVYQLTGTLTLPVSLEDERMTSSLSEELLKTVARSGKKDQIQMESARILLDDVLKRRRL